MYAFKFSYFQMVLFLLNNIFQWGFQPEYIILESYLYIINLYGDTICAYVVKISSRLVISSNIAVLKYNNV